MPSVRDVVATETAINVVNSQGKNWYQVAIAKPATQRGDLLIVYMWQLTTVTPITYESEMVPVNALYWGKAAGGLQGSDKLIGRSMGSGGQNLLLPTGIFSVARWCDGSEPSTVHVTMASINNINGLPDSVPGNYDVVASAISLTDVNVWDPWKLQETKRGFASIAPPANQVLFQPPQNFGNGSATSAFLPDVPFVGSGTMLSVFGLGVDAGDTVTEPIIALTYVGSTVTLTYAAITGVYTVGDVLIVSGVTSVTNVNGEWQLTAVGTSGANRTATFVATTPPTGVYVANQGALAGTTRYVSPTGMTVIRDRRTAYASGKQWEFLGYKTWTQTALGHGDGTSTYTIYRGPWINLLSGPLFRFQGSATGITFAGGPRARHYALLNRRNETFFSFRSPQTFPPNIVIRGGR